MQIWYNIGEEREREGGGGKQLFYEIAYLLGFAGWRGDNNAVRANCRRVSAAAEDCDTIVGGWRGSKVRARGAFRLAAWGSDLAASAPCTDAEGVSLKLRLGGFSGEVRGLLGESFATTETRR